MARQQIPDLVEVIWRDLLDVGLRTRGYIAKNTMVMEYIGDTITAMVAEARRTRSGKTYLAEVTEERWIDARKGGNLSLQRIETQGEYRIAVELTITNGDEECELPCLCNSSSCKGTLGEQAKAGGATIHGGGTPERTPDPPGVIVIETTLEGEPLESRTPELCSWMFHKHSQLRKAVVEIVRRVNAGEWGMGGGDAATGATLEQWMNLIQLIPVPEQWWKVLEATGAPKDAEVTLLKTETVTMDMILTLKQGNMVGSDVLNMWAAMLATETWPSAPATQTQYNSRNVMYASMYFYDHLQEGLPGSWEWALDEEVLMDWGQTVRWDWLEIVVVPICQRLHWMIVVADITNSELNCYDSLGRVGSDKFERIGKWINWRLKQAKLKPREWSYHQQKVSRQMPGSNDCAMTPVAVMFNVRHGQLQASTLPVPEKGNEMCKLMMWMLLRGCIEKETIASPWPVPTLHGARK
eukprot:1252561-Rhodomonas_salina.1